MTHRIEPSFFHDSKNWTFWNVTQRIEPFSSSKKRLKEFNLSQCDSKNWTFLSRLKELNEPSSFKRNITQRIEHFFSWTWRTELNLFLNMTHRIEPLKKDSKNWTAFQYDLKELNFFFDLLLKRLEPFFWFMTQKNWTFFLEHDAENTTQRTGRFLNMTQWIEPFFQYDSKNWTFDSKNWTFSGKWLKELFIFWNVTKKWTFFLDDSKNWTFLFYDSKNWTSFTWLKELNLFNTTQRIEPFFHLPKKKDAKNLTFSGMWPKELNPFKNMTRRIATLFFKMTQRI